MLKSESNLYLVISEEYCNKSAVQVAAESLDAGVACLQMREKSKPRKEALDLGGKLRALCKNVPFIVNDDPRLAIELNADGVHLGQEDFAKYPNVRKIMGKKIIGLSTHCLEQVKRANRLDVDYIAFGPIFETKTKAYSIGVDSVDKVLNIAAKPVVFIGGINEDNLDKLTKLGARNIAVIRALTQAKDIPASVMRLKGKISGHLLITLNGRRELVRSRTLSGLLKEKNFNTRTIIVEYNKEVASPSRWDAIELRDNDNLEIVSMVSGG